MLTKAAESVTGQDNTLARRAAEAVQAAKRRIADLENLVWHEDVPPHLLYHVGGLIARIRPDALDPDCPNRARRLSEAHESLYQLLECADDHAAGKRLPDLRAGVIDMMAWLESEIAGSGIEAGR